MSFLASLCVQMSQEQIEKDSAGVPLLPGRKPELRQQVKGCMNIGFPKGLDDALCRGRIGIAMEEDKGELDLSESYKQCAIRAERGGFGP